MRLSLNALATTLEALVMGVMLFVLFWFLNQTLPIEDIGVYSLVLGTMAFSQMANLGMAQSAMHFVPRAMAEGDNEKARTYIDTIWLSLFAIFTVMALVMYYPIAALLSTIPELEGEKYDLALELLPWALFSLILSNVGLASAATIRALHFGYIASFITVTGTILQFVIAYFYLEEHGLVAMGWAQAIQAGFILLSSTIVMWRLMPGSSLIPYRFRKAAFKDTINYGARLVVMGLFTMFLQPATKYMLGQFAGLAAVGYYEFAERMMLRVSKLVTQANQVMIPAMAQLSVNEKEKMRTLYAKANRVVAFSGAVLFSGLAAGVPAIEYLWLGESGTPFVLYSLILCATNIFTVAASPSYSLGLGVGDTRWNMIGFALQFVFNIIFGGLLGYLFGGLGVVIGVGLALALGNMAIMAGNAQAIVGPGALEARNGLATIGVLILGVVGVLGAHYVYNGLVADSFVLGVAAAVAVISAALAPSLLFHPGAQAVLGAVRKT